MTQKIQKIGSFLKTDKDGFICKEASIDKIQTEWKAALDLSLDFIFNYLNKKNIHSIYVRGSVAKGKAIRNISDIDLILVLKNNISIDDTFYQELQSTITKKFFFVTDIETICIPHKEVSQNRSASIMIKTQAACLYGKDISDILPPIKPGIESAQHIYKITQEVSSVKKLLIQNKNMDTALIKTKCTWIMKRLLRTACELVMEKDRLYTRDLYLCYKIFSKHYPKKKKEAKNVLDLAINPTNSSESVLSVLNTFGDWLTSEVRKYLETHHVNNL